jgi:hypothetical protein
MNNGGRVMADDGGVSPGLMSHQVVLPLDGSQVCVLSIQTRPLLMNLDG